MKRRALLINHIGLGNGILTLPILQRLEEVAPDIEYFYPDNLVFRLPLFRDHLALHNLAGLYPAIWRRFSEPNVEEIKQFIEDNRIDLIINLRNELPRYDKGYYAFREQKENVGITFWEIDFETIKKRGYLKHIVEDQLAIFRAQGLELEPVNWQWMKSCFPETPNVRDEYKRQIGMFVVSSQKVKQLPPDQWISVGKQLLSDGQNKLVIYGSTDAEEHRLVLEIAEAIQKEYGTESCTMYVQDDFEAFCQQLTSNDIVISNDSMGVHVAAALDIPVVGVYISSIGAIWGGVSDSFTKVQGRMGADCHFQKEISGSCLFYYDGCPAPCRYHISVEEIVLATELLMKKLIINTYESKTI